MNPLDVLVLCQEGRWSRSRDSRRTIGLMTMIDVGEEGPQRIIAVAIDDPEFNSYKESRRNAGPPAHHAPPLLSGLQALEGRRLRSTRFQPARDAYPIIGRRPPRLQPPAPPRVSNRRDTMAAMHRGAPLKSALKGQHQQNHAPETIALTPDQHDGRGDRLGLDRSNQEEIIYSGETQTWDTPKSRVVGKKHRAADESGCAAWKGVGSSNRGVWPPGVWLPSRSSRGK